MPDASERRDSFLLGMYQVLMKEIDRHIMVTWQSLAAVGATLAFIALIGEGKVESWFGTSIVLTTCFWAMLVCLDSGYWYNRNLVIIANIERQFMLESDGKDIHFYFKKHRDWSLIDIIRIQFTFVSILFLLAGLAHVRTLDGTFDFNPAGFLRALPIGLVLLYAGWVFCKNRKYKANFDEFKSNSPGVNVEGGVEHSHH